MMITLVIGPPLILAVGSVVYRRLGLMPLFLPHCPHCRARSAFLDAGCGPQGRLSLVCNDCGGLFHLWVDGTPSEKAQSPDPEMLLCFPQVLGCYSLLHSGDPERSISLAFPEEAFHLLFCDRDREDQTALCNGLKNTSGPPLWVKTIFPELLQGNTPWWSDPLGLVKVQTQRDATLFKITRSTDQATNLKNLWRLRKLTETLQHRYPHWEAYCPEEVEDSRAVFP